MNQLTHILLVEDNPGDADLVRDQLAELARPIHLTSVDRMAAALEFLAREQPAAVLLDLNLPDSHGADTFRTILDRAPGVPIVILSGQDDEELAIHALHQGVQDYLLKGEFDSKHLSRAIRYASERQALTTSLELSRRQQLEFKNQFLSHVSHELRTPLTCIHQFVTILLDQLSGPINTEQREHLRTILNSVTQLRAMIGDLLEATRAEAQKIRIEARCMAVGELIRQATSMMQATARAKQVGIEVGIDARIGLAYADPDRVLQVLINLIDNAIKFTPADGAVTVRACLVESDPDFVYLSVADTGCGIAPEARPLIFERLYQDPNTVDNRRKGLGLGLYIAKELVHLHNGRIWVESQPGSGSTFTFTLPLFSLSKLLFPVITEQGRLRESIVLVEVDLLPLPGRAMGNWEDLRRRCRDILEHCIYADKDLVLPAMGSASTRHMFFIVASTDLERGQIMLRRIRDRLDRSVELKMNSTIEVSARGIWLPNRTGTEKLEDLVQEVADRATEMALAADGQREETPIGEEATPAQTPAGASSW
jgi:signal transduction histidine kinase